MLIVRRAKSDFTETKRVPFATGINANFCNSVFSEEDIAPHILSKYCRIRRKASSTVIIPDEVGQCASVSSPLPRPTICRCLRTVDKAGGLLSRNAPHEYSGGTIACLVRIGAELHANGQSFDKIASL
uniref:Uncharacterized protein n=1 Tax=Arundo donax TaxID=35708 RepID=A0A0A9BZJ9_ARUDO